MQLVVQGHVPLEGLGAKLWFESQKGLARLGGPGREFCIAVLHGPLQGQIIDCHIYDIPCQWALRASEPLSQKGFLQMAHLGEL